MFGRRAYSELGIFTVCLLTVLFVVHSMPHYAFAQSASEIDELRDQIDDHNDRLAEIDKEIAQLEGQLNEVGAEKNTLQSAINTLELERRKVSSDIAYTQNRIGATDLEISKLGLEINETEQTIATNEAAIGEIIRRIDEHDQDPLFLAMVRHSNLSELWNEVEQLFQARGAMSQQVRDLLTQKEVLHGQRESSTEKREELVELKEQYDDQHSVLANNKAEKDQLLQATKNEEAAYQRLLAEKRAAREQLEKEIQEYESQLQFILDPDSIPSAGNAVFNWPLASVQITQYFGNTAFAQSGAYNGSGHNGVDFGAPSGTKIFAPLSGTVRTTGNTDAVAGCYSWGKWTLIDHANGLSTLYAHQSVISVSPGQQVKTGDVIGYVGNTGYSTGPHLHFTVYVREAVSVQRFSDIKTVTNCGGATTPVSALNGYLNPLDYLP